MLLFNRKAYTLSQFILLWILGILFVILVFLNVLRYRATTQAQEAESFMQEIRAEQEDRCALGRKYAVYNNHLKTFYKRKNSTKAIRYDLSSGQGITAHHKLLDFRLQMPSYADGRICCDNCGKLNHYYTPCDVLQKSSDFVMVDSACAVYPVSKKGKKKLAKTEKNLIQPESAEKAAEQPQASVVSEDLSSSDSQDNVTSAQTTPASSQELTEKGENPHTEVAQPVTTTQEMQEPQKEVAGSAPVAKTPKKSCKIPPQGDFFIDGCEVYQSDARGSVVHTWNFDLCKYEATQSCVIPAKWKAFSETKEEKGLYPSDLEDYCKQVLNETPCAAGAAAGQECGTADTPCYKRCKITEQTEIKESSLIVLYDIKVQLEQLRCMPARDVTVKIP